MAQTIRSAAADATHLGIIYGVTTGPLARHLLRARDLADSSYAAPLDLDALAHAANVSPRHFSRSFRSVFGETPYQYLITRRLERARHLLRTTDRGVAEICLDVGFASVGSFTTTFRRHIGVTPTASACEPEPVAGRFRPALRPDGLGARAGKWRDSRRRRAGRPIACDA